MKKFAFLILGLIGCILPAQAQTYEGQSSVQLLYGEGFDPADEDLATLTLEHAGSFGVFEHFGFADILHATNEGETDLYTEYYPKLSLGRTTGRDFNVGPLSDVLIGGGVNALFDDQNEFRVWMAGPVWKFNIPGFDLVQLETYYYRQEDFGGNDFDGTYQVTPSWDATFEATKDMHFRARGFVDFIGDTGPGEPQIVAQPQFLIDIGNVWNNPGTAYAGTEWRYWHNKGGADGVTESVPQFELMIQF